MIISMSFSIICYYEITKPNQEALKQKYGWRHETGKFDRHFEYYLYLQNPNFDYFNGVWLVGGVCFMAFLMAFLDIPDPIDGLVTIIKKRWGKPPD